MRTFVAIALVAIIGLLAIYGYNPFPPPWRKVAAAVIALFAAIIVLGVALHFVAP
jgi:type IV secretory pathway VirB2 component (pilin)